MGEESEVTITAAELQQVAQATIERQLTPPELARVVGMIRVSFESDGKVRQFVQEAVRVVTS